tara:strand:- start:281 stop:430 length:150 start_codon:yes stop_codon:yes gene_type:complete
MSIRRKSTKYARRRTTRLIGLHNSKFEKKTGLSKFIDELSSELSSLFKK